MENTKDTLLRFIEKARVNRNYPATTAEAIKAAFRLFEKVLNDEEKASINVFRDHLESIYQDVARKNDTVSPASLLTYKRRIERFLRDYFMYGVDPTKMATWQPSARSVSKRKKTEKDTSQLIDVNESGLGSQQGMTTHYLQLRPGVRAVLSIPFDLSRKEAEKLKTLIGLSVIEEEQQKKVAG